MPTHIALPTIIEAHGNLPKIIREYVGRVNSGDHAVSVAHMSSPEGWEEPGQRPEFMEITLVLSGTVIVEFDGGELHVEPGQCAIAHPGEWVRYRTPHGADYVAICLPAFSPETVHRD